MNCLVFALFLSSSLCIISAQESTTPDYREKYDHLWLEWVNERIREGERYLERLSNELKEWQTHHNEELRKRIEMEVQISLDDIKAALTRFETELKNPGLDLMEKYILGKAESEGKLVITLLTDVQKQIKKP